LRNGYGEYLSPDGDEYEGDWYMGEQHGNGIHTYPNGDVYEGEFAHGLYHGQGTLNDDNEAV
jgi:hypothetical protein